MKSGEETLVGALNQDQVCTAFFVDAMGAAPEGTRHRERAGQPRARRPEPAPVRGGLRLKRTERMTEKVRRE